MDTSVRKKIGKYEILQVVGRGGMGVVYRAEDPLIGRAVAIKTLNESLDGQPEMLKRFYREAQAPLHPNIAIVFDVGAEDGKPFIVMEYVDGEGLDRLIGSDRPLSLIEKLSVIEQVCTGLGFAHQSGVIHRDIKPANIMVRRNPILAKIVDFGIASVQKAKFETGLTQTGTVIGSVHYISPERLKGEPFDGRSDIWATGVMLYQLLCGQLPFPGGQGEELAIMHRIIDEPHPPLSRWLLDYPQALDAIIERALAKDPEDRYTTAEEFCADLRIINEGLKRNQVGTLFADAERLTTDGQFTSAREVLRQLTTIDPQHTGARQLLGIVNQHLTQLQRAEELRKLVAEADAALAASNFTDALTLFDQAIKRDPLNAELKSKLEIVKEAKQRHDEVAGLMTKAEWLRDRGDWTGALKLVEKSMQLIPDDANLRAAHSELSQQVQVAARQGQLRDLLAEARQGINSGQFTAAIELLKKASEIDSAVPEVNTLLQTAITGQEQERRRKILEQIQAEIENCLNQENFERAADLVDRALEQLPSEPSLLQLKTRVAVQARKAHVRSVVDTTIAQAQEIFFQSPGEALLIVQKALEEVPGEERLLALEDGLRQRLKAAEKEEIRGRYLREAQGAMGHAEFEKAIEILESYQFEFADEAGVGELLEIARGELAQQQRAARIAACVAQVRPLLVAEDFDQAIRLLETASAETGDLSLQRLLTETREQQVEAQRKIDAALQRIVRLRERGQFDEALRLIEEQPSAAIPGSPLYVLREEIGNQKRRKEATDHALSAATQAAVRNDFAAALEALQAVRSAWGDSPELTQAQSDIEARRQHYASKTVAEAVETARTALLANNAAAARDALRSAKPLVEFAGSAQQTAWRRLNDEAAKSIQRSAATSAATEADEEPEVAAPSKLPLLLGIAAVLSVAVGAGIWWFHSQSAKPAAPQPQTAQSTGTTPPPAPVAAPSGTLVLQGNVGNADVFVDGALKGFTQADGSLKLTLDPGKHSIQVTKAGYSEAPPASVNLALNAQQAFHFSLAPSGPKAPPETVAYLSVHTNPGAAISIDNAPQGTSDAHGNLVLSVKPGTRSLSISLPGYQSYSQSLNLKLGDHDNNTVMLLPIPKPAAPAPKPVQIDSFSASAVQIVQGHSTTLGWQTENASEVTIDNGIGQVDASGQTSVSPSTSTKYLLTARGNGGTQQRTVSIVVEAPAQQPSKPAQAAAAPAPPPVDQNAPVEAVLANFNAALHAHNVARMRSIWTGMSGDQAKAFQNLFKSFPQAAISDDCSPSTLAVSGDTASWTCTETTRIDPKSDPHVQKIRFGFSKKDGAWTISERR